MSVVIYSKGAMVADSRAWSGTSHPAGDKRKIHRLNDGSIIGITSNVVGAPEELVRWINEGEDKEAWAPANPSWSAIRVKPDGSVWLYDDAYFATGPLEGEFFTIGSGRKYALGALHAGADIFQAGFVAIACDPFCGGKLRYLSLNR